WQLRSTRPATAAALREAVYAGDVFLAPPTEASLRLVATVRAELAEVLGCTLDEIRDAPQRLPNAELFARIGELRRRCYLEPRFHEAVRDVISACDLDPARVAFDPLRLRVIQHQGHHNPLAAPVYHPHRDTWYAHPRALIAWWIPLDDLAADETFVFYPERFAAPVANDSEIFDYAAWVRDGWQLKIGWQQLAAGVEARYPRAAVGADGGAAVGFSCRAGDNLVFSGAQFHATLPQATGRTRFSLDFRIVDLDDHAAGLGAPDVDNRSRGSALVDYVHPR
ncbi:MAG: phytanoyl-CoA dioxygenase family protein, partial [Myxococcota bacterium]|nr:phytanoyl-CoA dioxygenase family protein [Myxococcota bacterium]